jgi:hypothetical protein
MHGRATFYQRFLMAQHQGATNIGQAFPETNSWAPSPPPHKRPPSGLLSVVISTRLDAQRFEAGNHIEQLLVDATLAQTVE